MDMFKKKKKNGETAAAVAPVQEEDAPAGKKTRDDYAEVREPKQQSKKKGLINQIGDAVGVAKGIKSSVDEIYGTWIKPIMDNRVQIRRRWNGLVTAVSVVFFLLYVPILLFSKISKGLSLGWDIALYVCLGVYVAAVIVMLIITVASGKSATTQASKRWRKASGIILFVVRIASLALSVTAIAVSGKAESTAIDVILMVLAIVSIVFTSLSLIFGGFVGFFKWLISPAKIRRTFSFVALEWQQALDDGLREQPKAVKKSYNRHREKVSACLDGYLLPAVGKAYIDTVKGEKLLRVLDGVPVGDRNLTEWILKDIFDYASACGYAPENPCDGLELEGDILREKAQRTEGEGVMGRFASLFRRRSYLQEEAAAEDGEEDDE